MPDPVVNSYPVVDVEGIVDELYTALSRGINNLYVKLRAEISDIKTEISVDTYNIVNNIVSHTNNQLHTLFGVVHRLSEDIAGSSNAVGASIVTAESNIRMGQDDIIDQISSTRIDAEDNTERTIHEISEGVNLITNNITDSITDTINTINTSSDEIIKDVNDVILSAEGSISNSIVRVEDNLTNRMVNSNDIIVRGIDQSERNVITNIEDSTKVINDNVDTVITTIDQLPADLLLVADYMMERIEEFVLEHFDYNLENLSALYEMQYKAKANADAKILEEMRK